MTLEDNNSDINRYKNLQEQKEKEWEDLCTCCGACCGSLDGDPCEYLKAKDDGKYCCDIYYDRFGFHKTLGGKSIKCVPIRKILFKAWIGSHNCAYKKWSKNTDPTLI